MPGAASRLSSGSTSLPEAARREVWTPAGPARLSTERPDDLPRGVLLLGHSAGGGPDAPDLLAVTAVALTAGLVVVRTEQPYRVAGRRAPAPAARLDEAWQACAVEVRTDPGLADVPLVAGGRSSGARVACRTAGLVGAVGVLALAFPMHPPSNPARTRLPELVGAGVPALVVQGTRDAFGAAASMQVETAGTLDLAVLEAPGADHSLRTGLEDVLPLVGAWLRDLVASTDTS